MNQVHLIFLLTYQFLLDLKSQIGSSRLKRLLLQSCEYWTENSKCEW